MSVTRFNLIRNMRIRYLVGLTGFVALSGLLFATIIFDQGQESRNVIEKRRITLERGLANLETVQYDLLNARRREKDFLLRFDMKYISLHRTIVEKTQADLNSLHKFELENFNDPVAVKVAAQLVLQAKTEFDNYGLQFQEVSSRWIEIGLDENSGLYGSLRRLAHEIEAITGEIADPRLTVSILQMRRHEKDFMQRVSQKYIDRMTKTGENFLLDIAETVEIAKYKEQLQLLVHQYQKEFLILADKRIELLEETRGLSKLFSEMELLFNDLKNIQKKNIEQESVTLKEAEDSIAFSMNRLLLFDTIAVLLITIIIARSISAPVTAVTKALNQLAAGDLTAQFSGGHDKSEFGEMAAAANIFKEQSIAFADQSRIASLITKISNSVQLTEKLDDFGQVLLTELFPSIDAVMGAFYVFDTETKALIPHGSYACDKEVKAWSLGKGLVGECGLLQQPIITTNVPPDYFAIRWGNGRSPPSTLVFYPLIFTERLKGVLELAYLKKPTNSDENLFHSLLPTIALNLENLMRQIDSDKLLEEAEKYTE